MRRLIGWILLALVIAGAIAGRDGGSGQKPDIAVAAKSKAPDQVFATAAEIDRQWRDYLGKKRSAAPNYSEYAEAARALGDINGDWPRADEAAALLKRMRAADAAVYKLAEDERKRRSAEVERILEKGRLAVRKKYPAQAERAFLDNGMDVYVTTVGKDARTLRIRYILMSRPLVHQMQNNGSLISTWREAGFHRVIMTDGYNSRWTLDLR